MPRGDGTGPSGMGPMTGRAAGYCAGYSVPGYMGPSGGRYSGIGRDAFGGRGRGRGYRNWYYATGLPGWARYNTGLPAWGGVAGNPYYDNPYPPDIAPEEEIGILKDQADMLKEELNDIQARMKELQKKPEKKEK